MNCLLTFNWAAPKKSSDKHGLSSHKSPCTKALQVSPGSQRLTPASRGCPNLGSDDSHAACRRVQASPRSASGHPQPPLSVSKKQQLSSSSLLSCANPHASRKGESDAKQASNRAGLPAITTDRWMQNAFRYSIPRVKPRICLPRAVA